MGPSGRPLPLAEGEGARRRRRAGRGFHRLDPRARLEPFRELAVRASHARRTGGADPRRLLSRLPRADDRPRRALGAIKEFGLPYAYDGADHPPPRRLPARPSARRRRAVQRRLAAFRRLRDRLVDEIGRWQEARRPLALENARPDLAVACGAAYSGRRSPKSRSGSRPGSARAVFLEAHREARRRGEVSRRSLVCILPHGAAPVQAFELDDLDLHLRINRLVRFQVYTSTRHEQTKAGDVVERHRKRFTPCRRSRRSRRSPRPERRTGRRNSHPVERQRSTNWACCRCPAAASLPKSAKSWPLEFNLRPHERPAAAPGPPAAAGRRQCRPGRARRSAGDVSPPRSGTAPAGKRDKFTAPRLMEAWRRRLGRSKGDWNGILLRDLWTQPGGRTRRAARFRSSTRKSG